MSAIERIGVALMSGATVKIAVRSDGPLVRFVTAAGSIDMTISEAKAWREGLSRAIRQAEAAEASK